MRKGDMEDRGKGEELGAEIVLKCICERTFTANRHQQSLAVTQEVGCDDQFPLSERPTIRQPGFDLPRP